MLFFPWLVISRTQEPPVGGPQPLQFQHSTQRVSEYYVPGGHHGEVKQTLGQEYISYNTGSATDQSLP